MFKKLFLHKISNYCNPKFWETDYKVKIIHDNADTKQEGDLDCTTIMTPSMVQAGLELMAKEYPKHFYDLTHEDGDNITHDVLFQCIILKDLIFG